MNILNNCFNFSQNVFIRNTKMAYYYCSCYHIDVGMNLLLKMTNISLFYLSSCAYVSCVRLPLSLLSFTKKRTFSDESHSSFSVSTIKFVDSEKDLTNNKSNIEEIYKYN